MSNRVFYLAMAVIALSATALYVCEDVFSTPKPITQVDIDRANAENKIRFIEHAVSARSTCLTTLRSDFVALIREKPELVDKFCGKLPE